jgi:hypothetical protein
VALLVTDTTLMTTTHGTYSWAGEVVTQVTYPPCVGP